MTSPVEKALLLFDQAYFDYRTMDHIDATGGWFLTRFKPNAKPEITDECREWRCHAIPLKGKQVQEILDDLHRDVIDVKGKVGFKRYVYNGMASHVVGISASLVSGTKKDNAITCTSRICRLKSVVRLISQL